MKLFLGEHADKGVTFLDGARMMGFEKRWKVMCVWLFIIAISVHRGRGAAAGNYSSEPPLCRRVCVEPLPVVRVCVFYLTVDVY